jgi:adenylate kinase
VFVTRLAAYNAQTAPLLPYYREQGKLTELDGMASVETVAGSIDAALSVVA